MTRFFRTAVLPFLLMLAGSASGAELTVSAAVSLTEAFGELVTRYETEHPGDRVQLNFAASGVLLQQLDQGAPVDVFASADQTTMNTAESRGLLAVDSRRDFARNTLVLVVPADSGLVIANLGDLASLANPGSTASAGIERIAIGNPDFVPAGRYARVALEKAGLWSALEGKLINTQNVRQALDYVARGEVDAGFVYATDASLRADNLRVALVLAEPVSYPVAVTGNARDPALASRFIDYLLSPASQDTLARYGFLPP